MTKNQSEEFEVRSDTQYLSKCLIQVKDICEKHDLFFWLNYGALLGMVRENRLLPWNNDVELGCWAHETSNEKIRNVADALIDLGYTCFYYSSFGTLNIKKGDGVDININLYWCSGEFAVRPHETASKYQDDNFFASMFYWLAVLIFMYPNTFIQLSKRKRKKDLVKVAISRGFSHFNLPTRRKFFDTFLNWSKLCGGVYHQTAIPKSFFNSFKILSFYGSEMNLPAHSEDLLAFIYGDDWCTPKDKWSFYEESNKSQTSIVFIEESFNYNNIDLE
tara:strand:+ start:1715 stop:2542 length:828 start_codon:yes stop_codon:yes gene_type:complete